MHMGTPFPSVSSFQQGEKVSGPDPSVAHSSEETSFVARSFQPVVYII